jgi:hypothetical protein
MSPHADSQKSGPAGELFVAAELLKRGTHFFGLLCGSSGFRFCPSDSIRWPGNIDSTHWAATSKQLTRLGYKRKRALL